MALSNSRNRLSRRDTSTADLPSVQIRRLGTVSYRAALALQQELVDSRRAGRVPDLLVMLQHPHVLTLGAGARRGRTNILAEPDVLRAKGVSVADVGRGGDVTYHGPGQLVGYPIVDLKPDRCDVRRYLRDLEEVMIRTARTFGVTAERCDGLTGVWVGAAKLGAIGVRISRWITSHGFALNVTTDLEYFRLIVPCGIGDRDVTSLAAVIGHAVPMEDVEDAVADHFGDVFGRRIVQHVPLRLESLA